MGTIYTHNSDPNPPHVFVVDVLTGQTIGSFNVTDPSADVVKDAQAIRMLWKTGELFLADIGDPTNSRLDCALWKLKEPGPGYHGTLSSIRYPVRYPMGPVNAEALAIHPVDGSKYIITKETTGRLLRLPATLQPGNINLCQNMNKPMPAQVTDATFTLDGKWVLIRAQGVKDTIVYNASTWAFDGYISTPNVASGKAITMEPNGQCFLLSAGGPFASIYRVCMPNRYRAIPSTVTVLAGPRNVGSTQTYQLANFYPNAPVTVKIVHENGTTITQTVQTNAAGSATGSFVASLSGKWVITASQTVASGLLQATASVSILPGPPPLSGYNPQITFPADSQLAGEYQTFNLTGFVPNTSVTVKVQRVEPGLGPVTTQTLTTNASGSATGEFLPGNAGVFSVGATQTVSGQILQANASRTIYENDTPGPVTCDETKKPADLLTSIANQRWKLTLPTPLNCSNNADEKSAAQLAGGYEHDTFFHVKCPDNAVAFRAPVGGSKTSENTAYPRCELREMTAGGSQEADWTMGSGRHELDVTQAVTRLPDAEGTCRVVTAQIHGGGDDICVISCDAQSSTQTTGLELWASLDDEHNHMLIDDNYTRGAYFRVRMISTDNGGVNIQYDKFDGNGLRQIGKVNAGNRTGCFYKAGCYTQATSCPCPGSNSDCTQGEDFGEVRIKKLVIHHD